MRFFKLTMLLSILALLAGFGAGCAGGPYDQTAVGDLRDLELEATQTAPLVTPPEVHNPYQPTVTPPTNSPARRSATDPVNHPG